MTADAILRSHGGTCCGVTTTGTLLLSDRPPVRRRRRPRRTGPGAGSSPRPRPVPGRAAGPARPRPGAAMKLTDATRSATPSTSTGWRQGQWNSPSGAKRSLGSKARRQVPRSYCGVSPRAGAMISVRAACRGSAGSRWFQMRPSPPPPRSTRCISATRLVGGEPVETLGHRDGVDGPLAEGQGLGHAGHHRHRSTVGRGRGGRGRGDGGQRPAHAGHRLHGDDRPGPPDQSPGELARAGGEIDDPTPRPEPEHPDQPLHRLRRVAGPGVLVDRGGALESRRRLMHPGNLHGAVPTPVRPVGARSSAGSARARPPVPPPFLTGCDHSRGGASPCGISPPTSLLVIRSRPLGPRAAPPDGQRRRTRDEGAVGANARRHDSR